MPKRARQYYNVHDVYEEMDRIQRENDRKACEAKCAAWLEKIKVRIRVLEAAVQFCINSHVDVSCATAHNLEVARAMRAQLERIVCPKIATPPPSPRPPTLRRTGGKSSRSQVAA